MRSKIGIGIDLKLTHRALVIQSQRDCGLQPRVARNELPWVKYDGRSTRNGLWPAGIKCVRTGHNPGGVERCIREPQGRPEAVQPWALNQNPFGIQPRLSKTSI